MKKNLISIVVGTAFGIGLIASACASDGTIHFTGTIVDTTCGVDVTNANQNITVQMGKISTQSFNGKAGTTAGGAAFQLKFKNCQEKDLSAIKVRFTGVPDQANNAILALSNDAKNGVATGVGIAIFDQNNNFIPLATPTSLQNLTKTQASGAANELESNVATFIAKYQSTDDKVSAGTADGVMEFTLDYDNVAPAADNSGKTNPSTSHDVNVSTKAGSKA